VTELVIAGHLVQARNNPFGQFLGSFSLSYLHALAKITVTKLRFHDFSNIFSKLFLVTMVELDPHLGRLISQLGNQTVLIGSKSFDRFLDRLCELCNRLVKLSRRVSVHVFGVKFGDGHDGDGSRRSEGVILLLWKREVEDRGMEDRGIVDLVRGSFSGKIICFCVSRR
jgi:hypothetical protein